MKNFIDKWNNLCDILISLDNPLFYGPRMSIFANIGRENKHTIGNYFKKINIGKIIAYRFRYYRQNLINLDGKELYIFFSNSEATLKQIKLFIDHSFESGKRIVILTNKNVLEYRNEFFSELEKLNINYQVIESAPVWGSLFNIIRIFIRTQLELFSLDKILRTRVGIKIDKQKIFSFLYIDRLTYESGKYFFMDSVPSAIYSASDMTGGYHAIHALANEKKISNYVIQHGSLGILQSRHHPGTKFILWGQRHKEYIDKISQGKDDTQILNLHSKLFFQNSTLIHTKDKNSIIKRIVFISNGSYTASSFYSQNYVDSTLNIIYRLSEDSKYDMYIKLHPSEDDFFIKRIIGNKSIKLITKKMSVRELADFADICFSNYSTVSQEILHFNTVSLIYHPLNYVIEPNFVGMCMPECEFNDESSFMEEIVKLCDDKYYNFRLSIQKKILPFIFDQTSYVQK